jgi:hypothetical protein
METIVAEVSHMRLSTRALIVTVLALCASCTREPTAVAPLPTIESTLILHNEHNVLSGIVSVHARQADSIAVRYRLDGESADSLTAATATSGNGAIVPVLGLLPERRYQMRAVAYGSGGAAIGDPIDFESGALPSDLPRYTASGDSPMPGYVVFAAGMYGVVIDNTGRVVWYHRFPNGPWLNFMAQPNGRYVARLVTPDPSDLESWIEIDALGNTTRTFGCKNGLQPRFHDLISEPDGGYWTLCDETRTMDLRASGGVANAKVTGQAIQHVSRTGELLFSWSPFDHFLITDVDSATRAGPSVNWTHGNSLDIDSDGNILVSFRNLSEITKIDSRTGAVLWRLGGLRNQFALGNGIQIFAGQHSVRALGGGQLMLLDNVGDSLESRAERWAINAQTGTAQLIDVHGAVPRVRTLIGGSVQAVSSDRTLVSFGTEGRVEEYDAHGAVKWRIEGAPGYVFRAQRIRSLYQPGVNTAR